MRWMFSKNIEYISRLEKSVMAYKNAYIFHFRFDPLNVVGCNPYLILLKVKNIKYPFYIPKEEVSLLQEGLNGIDVKPQASFIAPLDNLLWDRKLIKEIFGFEYIWEVYKPVSERRYGYYVLPVL